ncbi:acyl-CoA dehydrogenase family protein [Streptomyces sp. CA-100214]
MSEVSGSALTDEDLRAIRSAVQAVGEKEIEPLAAEVDRTQQFSSQLWTVLSDLGVTALPFSTEAGGLGGTFQQFTQVIEEIAYYGACAALYTGPTVQVASAILKHGTLEQQQRWAKPLISDGALASWSFTEPATGSDPRSITTVAERTDSGWVLNGSKMFTSFAPYSQVALVFARTTPSRLGAFLVDTSLPGWNPGKPIEMLSFGGQGTAPVAIDDLEVPGDALLGDVEQGYEILIGTEAEAKIRASAICGGIGRRALAEATKYANERTHRDTPIGEKFPTVQVLLGGMSAQVDAARLLTRRAARAVDRRDPRVSQLAASSRIVGARMTREVTSDALQVCGAYGFTKEMVLERLYREGKFYEVGQGVIELQRLIVGKKRIAEFAATGTLTDTLDEVGLP